MHYEKVAKIVYFQYFYENSTLDIVGCRFHFYLFDHFPCEPLYTEPSGKELLTN